MKTTAPLAVGDPAPLFSLPASTGENIDLAKLVANGPVILFFYPKADTPGCTREACGFRDAAADFRETQAAVLGISPDPLARVIRFAQKYDIRYPLLADADHAVAERYGVWREKSLYGVKYMGVARTTFVVGKGGKVLHIFENVKPAGHEAQVLEWLRERVR